MGAYGLIVIEAAAYGTPCVTVDAADNAAKELIVEGVNGFVVNAGNVGGLADAIVEVTQSGNGLRESTQQWYRDHWHELSIDSSVERLAQLYEHLVKPLHVDG